MISGEKFISIRYRYGWPDVLFLPGVLSSLSEDNNSSAEASAIYSFIKKIKLQLIKSNSYHLLR